MPPDATSRSPQGRCARCARLRRKSVVHDEAACDLVGKATGSRLRAIGGESSQRFVVNAGRPPCSRDQSREAPWQQPVVDSSSVVDSDVPVVVVVLLQQSLMIHLPRSVVMGSLGCHRAKSCVTRSRDACPEATTAPEPAQQLHRPWVVGSLPTGRLLVASRRAGARGPTSALCCAPHTGRPDGAPSRRERSEAATWVRITARLPPARLSSPGTAEPGRSPGEGSAA